MPVTTPRDLENHPTEASNATPSLGWPVSQSRAIISLVRGLDPPPFLPYCRPCGRPGPSRSPETQGRLQPRTWMQLEGKKARSPRCSSS